ncbi:uncharacterized protein LOC122063420 [Macadamia integrifolia]|uniref:uncharacterized protein LOC122063420 n=1 Tax=Macadamia integrifolia TaxID=60698 RepID=UPI001C4F4D04|nr:uncharacterized protein LOC122063420 [Macadamia integrifolia]
MMDSCKLVSIPSSGLKFTWSNNRKHENVHAVLDRSLCNEEWLDHFSGISQRVLPCGYSDHSPIIISCDEVPRPTNIPFRMHRFWAEHSDFKNVVRASWEIPVRGTPIFRVLRKLKRLKGPLRAWARDVFPHVDHEVERTKVALEHIQELMEADGFSKALYDQEQVARQDYDTAIGLYEKIWAEKSRVKWLNEGDRCSKFFHTSAKMHRGRNTIREIQIEDGAVHTSLSVIGEKLVDHFENFHKHGNFRRVDDLLLVIPKLVIPEDNDMLMRTPTSEEIKHVVFDLDPSSAPGPDGFPTKVSDFIVEGRWALPLIVSDDMKALCDLVKSIPLPTVAVKDNRVWSLSESGCSGAGGVIRDKNGSPKCGFAVHEGVGTNFMVEFSAFSMGCTPLH